MDVHRNVHVYMCMCESTQTLVYMHTCAYVDMRIHIQVLTVGTCRCTRAHAHTTRQPWASGCVCTCIHACIHKYHEAGLRDPSAAGAVRALPIGPALVARGPGADVKDVHRLAGIHRHVAGAHGGHAPRGCFGGVPQEVSVGSDLRANPIGHPEAVDRGGIRERREIRSEGRPEFRAPKGARKARAFDKSRIVATLSWYCNGAARILKGCCNGDTLVLHE